MVGSPLGRRCKTDGSIRCKVEGPVPTSVLSAGNSPVLSSKKGAQLLKNTSDFSSKALCGQVTGTREFRSTRTRNRSSFLSPTISSSTRSNTESKKGYPVQVFQNKPRLKTGSESQLITMTKGKDTPAPRRAPLPPLAKTIKKASAPPQVLQEKVPIHTSIPHAQPAARHTKNSTLPKNSSKTQLSQQKIESKTPVHQSKFQKAPTSQLSSQKTRNLNSASQSEPSKQDVKRSGTQKPPVPPHDSATKKRIPTSINQSKSSTSKEEPIYYIMWEGPDDETFHSSGITCTLCEKDLSYMSDHANEYYDDVEPSVFPNVAILPCGHSFHSACLDGITPEENSSDPPCFICLSCMS